MKRPIQGFAVLLLVITVNEVNINAKVVFTFLQFLFQTLH